MNAKVALRIAKRIRKVTNKHVSIEHRVSLYSTDNIEIKTILYVESTIAHIGFDNLKLLEDYCIKNIPNYK